MPEKLVIDRAFYDLQSCCQPRSSNEDWATGVLCEPGHLVVVTHRYLIVKTSEYTGPRCLVRIRSDRPINKKESFEIKPANPFWNVAQESWANAWKSRAFLTDEGRSVDVELRCAGNYPSWESIVDVDKEKELVEMAFNPVHVSLVLKGLGAPVNAGAILNSKPGQLSSVRVVSNHSDGDKLGYAIVMPIHRHKES